MLYIQEEKGTYQRASADAVFMEASRLSDKRLEKGEFIGSSSDAKVAVGWKIRKHRVEVFACLFLDSAHNSLSFEVICSGTINCNTVHPREVVKAAFNHDASAVIIAHNHPSGQSTPSKEDIELTKKLKDLLDPLQIKVLDHLVVGDEVTSFSDLGLLK
ncbi:JAB domain-containing protein [Desulfogranum marinum]|uniref:JAB domain-containing protein n=1 Tax=Desulfogranum marinum TaxID=453220 RepID=UPI0029C9A933|nr:JAB domain-containing protein [Desulfogranum marinum]